MGSKIDRRDRLVAISKRGGAPRSWMLVVLMLMAPASFPAVQSRASQPELEAAARAAFEWLLALPADTAGAPLGAWVLDSARTLPGDGEAPRWGILAVRLTDTGRDLHLEELVAGLNTSASPREQAETAKAMQRLEGQIGRAEAESMLEVTVTLAPREPSGGDYRAGRARPLDVHGATVAYRWQGRWAVARDRELDVEYQRWIPDRLLVTFARGPAGCDITVDAAGNGDMLDRLARETNWAALQETATRCARLQGLHGDQRRSRMQRDRL